MADNALFKKSVVLLKAILLLLLPCILPLDPDECVNITAPQPAFNKLLI